MTWSGLLSDDKDACKCVCVCLCVCVFPDFQLVQPQTGSPTCSLLILLSENTLKQKHQLCHLLVMHAEICFFLYPISQTHMHMHMHMHDNTAAVFRLGHHSSTKIQITVLLSRAWWRGNYIQLEGKHQREREWRRKRRGLVFRVRSFPCDHQWQQWWWEYIFCFGLKSVPVPAS